MISLSLYDKPLGVGGVGGESFILSLEGYYQDWRRGKLAIGGFNLGKFSVKNFSPAMLEEFFNSWIGFVLVEYTFGLITYEGLIWEMNLVNEGINYRRTLNPKYFHNRVKVKFTDEATGVADIADWANNLPSQSRYGVMEYIYSIGKTHANEAVSKRDKELANHAFPRSKTVSSITVTEGVPNTRSDGLYITVAGFRATLNWLVQTADVQNTASAVITTLVNDTEFVVAGRIETNATNAAVTKDQEGRKGDLINKIVSAGETGGNIWKGGVYANRQFIYEPAPTQIDYTMRGGQLFNINGGDVFFPKVNPGFYLFDSSAPRGIVPAGSSNFWDDPKVSYCNELEYIYPDRLVLKFPGEKRSITVTQDYQTPVAGRKSAIVYPPPLPPRIPTFSE